jgi:starch-binding outer membrane protein, SusD/RagB family
MKKLILILLLTSLIAGSCEDFINILPESTVTIDVLYKTDKDFADALAGCYACFDGIYDGDQEYMGELLGDDMEHQWATESSAVRMDFFTFINDEPVVQNYWRDHYQAISRLNLMIFHLEKADASIVTKKDRYMGEAKFLRALSYFNLVRAFGDLPIVTAPITFEEAYQNKRQPVATVYNDVIYKDLLDAETKLPLKYTGADVGRATQGAAKSLLGKAYLTQKDFVKAEVKLKEVTTLGYQLLPNYNDLWDYSKDEHHKEYIFDIEYESGQGYGSNLTNAHMPQEAVLQAFYGIKGGGGSDLCPSDSLLSDPRTPEFQGLFIPEDKRRERSVANGHTNASGEWVPLPVTGLRRSFTMKYTCPVPAGGDSPANFKVIRYADVLLMLAEALNENNKTDEALTYLNMVRERAGVPTYSDLAKSTTRDKIELERRLELCFEGHRWWDLLRTGRAMQVMGPFGMKQKHWLYPIPLTEMQVVNNTEVLWQNPGWE